MPEDYFAKENIYGENGILLLGKGQRMTKKIMAKLIQFGIFKPNTRKFKENDEKHPDCAPWSGPGNDSGSCPVNNHENDPGYDPGDAAGYSTGDHTEYHPGYDTVQGAARYERHIHDGQMAETTRIINAIRVRMNIHNDRILEVPNKVLNTIIFDSKTEPWWVYVNALGNYESSVYTHSINVAIISLIIAKELGYSDKELWDIGLGAFLHDVGKLLIPRDILQKPGTLDAWEMAYMRQHCELGMISLKPYCLPKECTDIVMQHHERLDGSGYPRGLKGGEICLNARIAMVADAFDAISSSRLYRKPMDMDGAIWVLKDQGAKYPQDLVSLLEQILE
jgi:putative nucleotidyltransferase with HDIG domain